MMSLALVPRCHAQLQRFFASHLGDDVRYNGLLRRLGFDDAKSDEEKRSAIRAALIAMPLEVCRLLSDSDLSTVDELLAAELAERGVVDAATLPLAAAPCRVSLWQGDMSQLRVDAVVNPANSRLLGCFLPSHRCLDNILHAQSGPRLRIACGAMLDELGIEDDTNGNCRVTRGFALPASFVFHTIGPCLVDQRAYARHGASPPAREPTPLDAAELASCYVSCLDAALERQLRSIAFCCISTGIFGYPQRDAAIVALTTTRQWIERRKDEGSEELHVVFNVFKDEDLAIYQDAIAAPLQA